MNRDRPTRVRTLSAYFRETYGERAHKVSVDGGFTCPNRDGVIGFGGCAFCDATGSRAPYSAPTPSDVATSLRTAMDRLSRRFHARKFLVYFQAFSGTYAPASVLKARYDAALCDERIIGLSIATRSDCLSEEALDVVASYVPRLQETRLEFGLQTTNQAVLDAMGCGHSPEDFCQAAARARARGVKVCAHVIFGLPGDTVEHVLACAPLINSLGIEGVKIHNLFVTADSRLGDRYRAEPFPVITREDYIEQVCRFLAALHPQVVIERIVGDPPKGALAPTWRLDKRSQWSLIEAALEERGWRQGINV